AKEHVGAPDDHLAVAADAHLHPGDRLAHRPETVRLEARHGDDRRGLGGPVALQRDDTDLLPALGKHRAEGCTTQGDEAKASDLVEDRPEEEPAEGDRQVTSNAVQALEGVVAPGGIHAALNGIVEEL